MWACLDQHSADGADEVGMVVPCMWASGAWCEGSVRQGVFLWLEAFFEVVLLVFGACVRFIYVSWRTLVDSLFATGWACLDDVFPFGVMTLGA